MGVDDWLLQRFSRTKILIGFGVLAAVLLGGGWLAGFGGDSSYNASNEAEAKAQCEGFADKRLKAPASADYDLAASESRGSWIVTGTVDAENSLGAPLRSDVRCVIHFKGDRAYLDDIFVG